MATYRSTTQYDAFQITNETRPRLSQYGMVESPEGSWDGLYLVVRTDQNMVVALLGEEDFLVQYEPIPAPDSPDTSVVDSP